MAIGILIWLVCILLIWGSFLNVIGYRLVHDESIVWPGSRCVRCHTPIAWYDNIPVLSWIFLRGRCRTCKEPISFLYPFIELLTVVVGLCAFYTVPLQYLPASWLFCSALIAIIRSDLETMLISSYLTLYVAPVGIICSYLGYLPISAQQSMLGACIGYFSLYIMAKLFYACTKNHGLGQGDLELMALVGAFLGPIGVWLTLLIGSWTGAILGIAYILISGKSRTIQLPFGPFIALGALATLFWQNSIIHALCVFL